VTDEQEHDYATLFVRALHGDEDAYEQCLTGLAAELRAYVRARAGDVPWVDDVVQETLLLIHDARHTYDTRRSFAAWFYAIARHRLIDEFRRAARRRAREVTTELLPEPASVAPDAGEREGLEQALARLPRRQRQIITAMKFEGESVRDVAVRTGMTESAVKVTAHRGYKLLRQLLGSRGSND
jgi:RNA polymerase sigma-70 factor (ECF subfamily)